MNRQTISEKFIIHWLYFHLKNVRNPSLNTKRPSRSALRNLSVRFIGVLFSVIS